jgi:hypothetical protein
LVHAQTVTDYCLNVPGIQTSDSWTSSPNELNNKWSSITSDATGAKLAAATST